MGAKFRAPGRGSASVGAPRAAPGGVALLVAWVCAACLSAQRGVSRGARGRGREEDAARFSPPCSDPAAASQAQPHTSTACSPTDRDDEAERRALP